MELKSDREVEVTREKLRHLEEHYDAALQCDEPKTYARELSLRSLKRMINQMTEEIIRYESRKNSPAPARR